MISQQQHQQQTLKILPQQIQLLNLFQLNAQELQLHIRQEMDQNPWLEELDHLENEAECSKYDREAEQDYKDWDEYAYNDVPDYGVEYANYFNEAAFPDRPLAATVDFREEARKQLSCRKAGERILTIADYMIDCLDDSGLLQKELEIITDDFSFSHFMVNQGEVAEALALIQQLEPCGLGARNIRECWQLQLACMNQKRPDVKKAISLLQHHYDDFVARRFDRIMDALQLDEEEFRMIVQFLGTLNMRPVPECASSISPKDNIVPDIEISSNGDEYTIVVCGVAAENFRLSDTLQETIQATKDKGALQYLRSKMQSANWLLYALRQRNESMMKIMKAIISYQRDFFTEGDITRLQPMILKNIADMVGLDISTVSRLTSNKYADTPFGTIHLKDLFTEGIINKSGEVISNRVIRNALEEVISTEDKRNPFTDQQLVNILMNKGYKVARRTVAKYRDLMQIPVAQVRAMWA